MTTLKLTNIDPNDYILAIRAAKSFVTENKPNGIRHGTIYAYGRSLPLWDYESDPKEIVFYVYYTNAGMIVVRYSR